MRGPCACPRPGEMIQRVSMNPWRNRHSRGQAQGPHPSPHPPLVPTERRGRTRPDGRDYPLRLEKFIRMQDAPSPIRSAPFIRRQGRKRLNGYDSPIRSSKFIRVLPILVVKTHHRAPALACSSTLLAQVKNVLGRELRICIVFRLEGPGPIIGSLRSGTFTLFYMQGKEWEASPEYLCCCCTS